MFEREPHLSRSQWTRRSRNWGWWSGSEPPVPAQCPYWPPHTSEDTPAQGPPASQTHAADSVTGNQSAMWERERFKSFLMSYAIFCFIQSGFNSTFLLVCKYSFLCVSNLYEHESLHGFVPLQQNNPRLQSSTEILVTCVRIPHWEKEKVSRSNSVRVCAFIKECMFKALPMQHLWHPLVSGILVVRANLLWSRQQCVNC